MKMRTIKVRDDTLQMLQMEKMKMHAPSIDFVIKKNLKKSIWTKEVSELFK